MDRYKFFSGNCKRLVSVNFIFWLILALALKLDLRASGAEEWPVIGFTQAVPDLIPGPTCITHAGDGSQRLFVTEQAGRIRIIQDSNLLLQPFLDITNRVLNTGAEQGLLGVAFPPGFATNHHFYVYYTRKPDGWVVLSRFQVSPNPNLADTNGEDVILVIPKTTIIHNGGQIAFGPDGYLYVGVGDGGPEGDTQTNGQKTSTLLGKLLRIDVESGAFPYAIPPGNPFVGNTNYLPEIWALGLRNPWRFSFDRVTGDLYLGDVGQNRFEEINFQPAGSSGGQNYGWRIMEGTTNYNVPAGFTNFSDLTLPVVSYDHLSLQTDVAGSVIGGYVYRGPSESRMDGVYFYGDFSAGWVWGMKRVGTNWETQVLYTSPNPPTHIWISTFGEDEQGRLFMADWWTGKIYQVQDTHQAWAPTFSPSGKVNFNPNSGIINSNSVTVTCLTSNAVIHYTTNGMVPTESDAIVPPGGLIQVSNGFTNKARAFHPDLLPSETASAVYSLKVGTPIYTPRAGAVTNKTQISITTVTPGAKIYYTTNAAFPPPNPTTNSLLYAGPFTINGNLQIRAIAVASGFADSAITNASYSLAQVATPAFTPASAPITNGTTISITCATPDAVIYYTVDGSTPTTNSPVYESPFTINGGVTVKAFAVASSYLDSAVKSVFFSLVQTATPVFSPASGPVAYGASISISCATPGAVIYYTVDGSTPTTNSVIYSNPLTVTNGFTLSAMAVANEHLDSVVNNVSYTLIQAAVPTFNPPQGPLTNGTTISISCSTTNAVIRYTIDGSIPDTNSPIFSNPIVFNGPMTLQARAYASQFSPSGDRSTFYGLLDFKNTVVTTLAGTTASGFTNAVGSLARFSSPKGVSVDTIGNLFVADTDNNVIRKILPSGQVITFAGTGIPGADLGAAANAQFSGPTDVCVESNGNVYVADGNNCNRVCKIDTNAIVTLLANVRGDCLYAPGLWQLTVDATGNVYVGSWATVQKITPNGTVIGVTGVGCNCPISGWGVNVGPSVDAATNVYSATAVKLWKTAPDGSTELFAGGASAFSDGPRLLAGFESLQDAAVDASTNIFLSDTTRIRKLEPDGRVSTLAGTGVPGYKNGRGSEAQFNNAAGLCVDTSGNVYVADSGNNCIRKISPDTAGIGIADDWQRTYFGNVGIDPNGDPDHDGMNNYSEFWAGTDPLDANSVLAIERTSLVDNGQISIRWETVAGKSYIVQYSSDLVLWSNLGGQVQGDGGIASVIDTAPMFPTGQRYYRLILSGF